MHKFMIVQILPFRDEIHYADTYDEAVKLIKDSDNFRPDASHLSKSYIIAMKDADLFQRQKIDTTKKGDVYGYVKQEG